MGIIGNVKNFLNNVNNTVKSAALKTSLLAPTIVNDDAELEDEQEQDMPIVPDSLSGSSSNTGSSWTNEFLNTPTFDINSIAQTGAVNEPVQHFTAGDEDESNLDPDKIITLNQNKEENESGGGSDIVRNIDTIYTLMNPSLLLTKGLFNFTQEAASQVPKLLDWVGDVEYNSIVQGNMQSEMDRERNHIIKGGNPGRIAKQWDDDKSLIMDAPYIDVLEGRDDVIGQLYYDIFSELPDDPTYEEWMDAWEKFVKEIQDGDYFKIERLRAPNYSNPNLLLDIMEEGKIDKTLTSKKYSQEKWEEIKEISEKTKDSYKVGKSYMPTEDELLDYMQVMQENSEAYNEIAMRYKAAMGDTEESEEMTQARERFMNLSMDGIHEKIQTNIGSIDGGEASEAEINYNSIVEEQLDRILVYVNGIFELEKEALAKPENQRNYGDWYIIDAAARARKALDKYAVNLNDYMTRILNEGVNSKGEIENALDQFADGSGLNEVLTDGLSDIMGLEMKRGDWMASHTSPIDMFTKLANDGRYVYEQSHTTSPSQYMWNFFENKLSNIGESATELGQFIAYGTVYRLTNLFKGNNKRLRPQSMRYFDNDFSVGKLIETDDSWNKRTVKKYALEFGEYAPEVVINAAPDMLLIAYSGPGGAARTFTNIGRMGRALERIKFINNLRKRIRTLDRTLKGLDRVGAIGLKWANINSKNARIWNIVDRSLTQFALGQGMDGKMSIFDSESYSDTSFWISMWGSLLGDILPEAKDFWGVWRTGARGGRGGIRTAGVWDLVDFISQGDENARLIAAQMGKKYGFFSEEDLKNYVEIFANVSSAAEDVYKNLSREGKATANSWTKDLMYNYVKQAYGENSHIGKNVREIANNRATSPADIIKYVGNIPGTVKAGPYTSIIRLKHGTAAWVASKDGDWYDVALDSLDGGFDRRLRDGFTDSDIRKISSIKGYEDTYKNKDRLFKKVSTDKGDKYYLTEDGLERFNLAPTSITLESLGITFEQAENTRKILKEKMKNLAGNKLQEGTIDNLADFGGYDEVVGKVKEILC